ncbi:cytochrome C oxidase subunit IV family protein [Xanthobacter dioxanivorans]|uniref:Cytochrome C oxidase subunit IV family protein n=1 Tax=Xanthobacter dioxanivorans TaxID=2528964 RepID=A0A974SK72_9HYPH|nr:cytochrome C oxidase subunit IV family protein [Xanthobacter dioxanivorans]
MLKTVPIRATVVWLVLMILTCISLKAVPRFDWFSTPQAGVVAIIISFFKSRLIIFEFMEVKFAPLAVRRLAEAWCICVCFVLVAIYLKFI